MSNQGGLSGARRLFEYFLVLVLITVILLVLLFLLLMLIEQNLDELYPYLGPLIEMLGIDPQNTG